MESHRLKWEEKRAGNLIHRQMFAAGDVLPPRKGTPLREAQWDDDLEEYHVVGTKCVCVCV